MHFFVKPIPNNQQKGHLLLQKSALAHTPFVCALGRSGWTGLKHEGDGATPTGCWQFYYALYRQDREQRPQTALPVKPIHPQDGWCDAPKDPNYNRPVKTPYRVSHETLWRDDELYDIIVVLSHNQCPRKRYCGSAIFMHVAKSGYPPTEGCIALSKPHLRFILKHATPQSRLIVLPN